MDFKLAYSPESMNDLEEIRAYILKNFYYETIANKSVADILDGIDELGKFPNLGLNFDKQSGRKIDSEFTTYFLPLGKDLIFYLINRSKSELYILRIIPAKRDYIRFIASLEKTMRHYRE